ncbi:hypothetical protein ANO11243_056350 [Dothideomycetidae sp. 11243]|nr:hypothetical protein ANO11243_056350 [fungal sp. No.11243]
MAASPTPSATRFSQRLEYIKSHSQLGQCNLIYWNPAYLSRGLRFPFCKVVFHLNSLEAFSVKPLLPSLYSSPLAGNTLLFPHFLIRHLVDQYSLHDMTTTLIQSGLARIQRALVHNGIQCGFWYNREYDRFSGPTFTFNRDINNVFIGLFAVLVGIVGILLWNSCVFVGHQTRAAGTNKNGLWHLIQVILRAQLSPLSSALAFWRLFWAWRHRPVHAFRHCIGWIVFALTFHLALVGLAASMGLILTPQSTNRLLLPTNPGFPVLGSSYSPADLLSASLNTLNISLKGAQRVKDCDETFGLGAGCNTFVRPYLNVTLTPNQPCPWPGLCLNGNNSAFAITATAHSRTDLGINDKDSDAVVIVKTWIFAPLTLASHAVTTNSTIAPGNELIELYIGNTTANNYTFSYETVAALTKQGWNLDLYLSQNKAPSFWTPIPVLNRTDGDVTVMVVIPGSIESLIRNDDPVFGTNVYDHNMTMPDGTVQEFYTSKDYTTSIGILESYMVCQVNGTGCTPADGAFNLLANAFNTSAGSNFNAVQLHTIARVTLLAQQMLVYNVVSERGASALRLTESLSGLIQGPMPEDQYVIEMLNWAKTSLAILQQGIVDYVAQPLDPYNVSSTVLPGDKVSRGQTYKQLVGPGDGSTISYSTTKTGIALGVCFLISLVGSILIPTVSWIQKTKFGGRFNHLRLIWILQSYIQLQVQFFMALGLGSWIKLDHSFPITEDEKEFGSYAEVNDEIANLHDVRGREEGRLLARLCPGCGHRVPNSREHSPNRPGAMHEQGRPDAMHDMGHNF